MDMASFGGIIKVLFIIIIVYYGFKFAMRFLFPLLLYKVAKKAEQSFQQKQQEYYQQNNTTNQYQDQNTQHTSDKGVPHSTKVVGEYVDFEEIEDKK
ncbi:MAG: DUF4834 family protein [Flavobacteriaceae bacterium]|jgi:ABC-type transport system involved in cytochrome bd biosynthesis fused ATPase/permease subunit|nr:DUF4834 family protein [Flavobacteriaceae bacterium]